MRRTIENGRPERRFIELGPDLRPELRAAADGKAKRFSGHAAVFDTLSAELWGFYERIDAGAFDDALEGKNDVRFLVNHDANLVLARSKFGEGTLELSKDDVGLVAESDLPDTNAGRDAAVSLERGDVDQMSFGFRTLEDSWDEETHTIDVDGDEREITIVVRTLIRAELFDVSVVTFPAYPDTDAGLRYLGLATPGASAHLRVEVDTSEVERVLAGLEELGQRKGKVLSKKNRESIAGAIEALQVVLEEASSDVDDDEDDDERGDSDYSIELARDRVRALELALPTHNDDRR